MTAAVSNFLQCVGGAVSAWILFAWVIPWLVPVKKPLVPSQKSYAEAIEELKVENIRLTQALADVRWAALELDKKNRVEQFDLFMDDALELLRGETSKSLKRKIGREA